jgi:catechol 2,3-dioxygenase-like lactoylglutathione lyase family enzyme
MKRIILVIGVAVGVISMLVSFSAKSQTPPKAMKMNAGIITTKLKESKAFFERVLNFGVTFENDFYLLMHTPNHSSEISFLLPEHPTQQPLFHKAFAGKGMYLTIEVPDVDAEYKRIKALGIPLAIDIRNEEWGDRHFAIVDPNGVGIDIVTYAPSK